MTGRPVQNERERRFGGATEAWRADPTGPPRLSPASRTLALWAVAGAGAVGWAVGCSSNLDCSLNGDCRDGTCELVVRESA